MKLGKDPETGGLKGLKPEAFDMFPPAALEAISRVFHHGAAKYARDNWRKGYLWSWSFAALQRHLWRFWAGEDLDPDSGNPHLAHAGFHVMALLEFTRLHPGKDDRFKGAQESQSKGLKERASKPRLPAPTRLRLRSKGRR